ncbi:MAG: HAD hydrolase family protein [Vicinamibacterales bacterium]
MRYGVLAVDFDGTIAVDGVVDPGVRAALEATRAAGIPVILVTGRILSDLRHASPNLEFAEAVVAENGAVLAFPASGRTSRLHAAPPPEFLAELRRRGVGARQGDCVVETGAADAAAVLDVIRALELPLVLAFNRGRLMVLPQAVSKATGLGEALTALRLSSHNTLAIGDAENDHALLQAAEVGVAVAWGSPALTRAADLVLEGGGPPSVAGFLRARLAERDLPAPNGRRRVLVGTETDGTPLTLSVRDRNVLVSGDPRSGKSWVAGLLTEQLMLARYSVAVVDPEGDYRTLEALPGVRLADEDRVPGPGDLERAFRFPDSGLVIDLSHMPHARKLEGIQDLLPALARLRGQGGLPHRIVVDEAHYFLRHLGPAVVEDLSHGGYTLVTYRPADLGDAVMRQMGVVIATRHTDPREAAALARWTAVNAGTLAATLASLSVSEAVLLPPAEEAHRGIVRFAVAPRLTAHVRHRHKYADLPVPRAERFVFSFAPGLPAAASLAGLAAMLEQLPPEALDHHLRHHDFSRWLSDVFRDDALARDVREVERAYALHGAPDAAAAVVAAIRERYDLKGDPRR